MKISKLIDIDKLPDCSEQPTCYPGTIKRVILVADVLTHHDKKYIEENFRLIDINSNDFYSISEIKDYEVFEYESVGIKIKEVTE